MYHRSRAESGPEVELPITPMLDMAFQLLAFFILTYHPSALEGQIRLALPAAGQAKAKSVLDIDPTTISDPDAEPPSELTIVIKGRHATRAESAPDFYVVESLQGASPSLKTLTDLSDYLRRQVDRLKKERAPEITELRARAVAGTLTGDERTHLAQLKQFAVKIRPEGQMKFAFVVDVMDACAQLGFNEIGFAAPRF